MFSKRTFQYSLYFEQNKQHKYHLQALQTGTALQDIFKQSDNYSLLKILVAMQ